MSKQQFETTIAITIGNTNSYISINGTTVANADGSRATPSIANESEVGLAARQKWVRFPDNNYKRSDKKFWQALLADLKITANSNCGGKINEAFVSFILEAGDDLKMVETVVRNTFNKNHCILVNPERLVVQKLEKIEKESSSEPAKTISIIDFGGNTVKLTNISYDENTNLYQITNSKTYNFGGKDLIQKLVTLAETDFKRKNRQLMGGEDLSARSKRKLYLCAMQTMQTLSNSNQGNLHVDSIFEGIDLNVNVSRSRFVDLVKPVCLGVFEDIKAAAAASGSENSKVDLIYMVGGCSRIPCLLDLAKNYSHKVETLDFEETFGNLASLGEFSFGNLGKNVGGKMKEALKNGTFKSQVCPVSIRLNDQVLIHKKSPIPTTTHGPINPSDSSTFKISAVSPDVTFDLTESFDLDNANKDLNYLLSYDIDGSCNVEFYREAEVVKSFVFGC